MRKARAAEHRPCYDNEFTVVLRRGCGMKSLIRWNLAHPARFELTTSAFGELFLKLKAAAFLDSAWAIRTNSVSIVPGNADIPRTGRPSGS
jgi:hypothetical protein